MDRFAVQTDKLRDQFIGVLSYDLRTPLGAITAGAALLAYASYDRVLAHLLVLTTHH